MKRSKILLNISNLSDLEEYKKLGISNFLFPLEGYSIGYETFTFEEIEKSNTECYVLINRVLTDADIDAFMKLVIPKNVRGFIIEDIGLYYSLKESNYELIGFQNHLNNNKNTIEYWLNRFDSMVLSTDITLNEIREILEHISKPVIFSTFGYPMIMYSCRNLISNYSTYHELEPSKSLDIDVLNSEVKFHLEESKCGTAVFVKDLLDARSEADSLDEAKIKFYLFDTNRIDAEVVKKAICGEDIEGTSKGFLYTKTIYKVGDIK